MPALDLYEWSAGTRSGSRPVLDDRAAVYLVSAGGRFRSRYRPRLLIEAVSQHRSQAAITGGAAAPLPGAPRAMLTVLDQRRPQPFLLGLGALSTLGVEDGERAEADEITGPPLFADGAALSFGTVADMALNDPASVTIALGDRFQIGRHSDIVPVSRSWGD